jgi:hypothetical protein
VFRNRGLEISVRDLQLDELGRAVVARQAGSDALAVVPNRGMHGNDNLIVANGCLAALLGAVTESRCSGHQRGGEREPA